MESFFADLANDADCQSSTKSQPPASLTLTSNDDQYSRASALLNSVIDSIKDQPSTLNMGPITKVPSTSSDDISPATCRNRALALVLFSEEDTKDLSLLSPKEEHIKSIPEHQAVISTPFSENSGTNLIYSNAPSAFNPSIQSLNSQHPNPAYTVHRNISLTRVPQTPQQEAELVREVQKKAKLVSTLNNLDSLPLTLATAAVSQSQNEVEDVRIGGNVFYHGVEH